MNGPVSVLQAYNDQLIAGGDFTIAGGVSASRIACWDGTAWRPLGAGVSGGTVLALTARNNEVIAGGSFTIAGGHVSAYWARWGCTDAIKLLLLPVQLPGKFPFTLYGPSGTTGRIQRSSNLQSWSDWMPFSLGDVPLEFTDSSASTNATQFYRAVSE